MIDKCVCVCVCVSLIFNVYVVLIGLKLQSIQTNKQCIHGISKGCNKLVSELLCNQLILFFFLMCIVPFCNVCPESDLNCIEANMVAIINLSHNLWLLLVYGIHSFYYEHNKHKLQQV